MTRTKRAPIALLIFLPLLSCSSGSHRPMPLPIGQPASPGSGGTSAGCSALSLGPDAAFHGFVPDASDAWHQDISAARVAENSAEITRRSIDLGNARLHPDFGSQNGIPYNVVDSARTPLTPVRMTLYGGDESDATVAPIPSDAAVEGDAPACTESDQDQHLLVVDRATCSVYEYFEARSCHGEWSAGNVALFDLKTPSQRPFSWTSADAAGLSILEGVVRYDEILAGHIDHAIRFTTRLTKKGEGGSYVTGPATHGAGQNTHTDNIMGMRVRLRPDFDLSGFSPSNQVILRAMQRYGMILADNGGTMYFSGTRDPRWDDVDLKQLARVRSTDFEVLEMGEVRNTAQAHPGPVPQIVEFRASPAVAEAGAPVTLSAVVSGASYAFVDQGGFLRDRTMVVHPLHTTRYKLTARNEFGSASQEIEVQVK